MLWLVVWTELDDSSTPRPFGEAYDNRQMAIERYEELKERPTTHTIDWFQTSPNIRYYDLSWE